MTINSLERIEEESHRFQRALKAAINRLRSEGLRGDEGNISEYLETGAVKRAALDLKQVLTKNL
jgi:hypothetical protein